MNVTPLKGNKQLWKKCVNSEGVVDKESRYTKNDLEQYIETKTKAFDLPFICFFCAFHANFFTVNKRERERGVEKNPNPNIIQDYPYWEISMMRAEMLEKC